MADMLLEDDELAGQEDFDPASLPLGTFAAFDVSDEPMWTTAEDAEHKLNTDQVNAIRAMVDAAAKADSVARRIEVQGAWMLELLDRGFHRIKPTQVDGGVAHRVPCAQRQRTESPRAHRELCRSADARECADRLVG